MAAMPRPTIKSGQAVCHTKVVTQTGGDNGDIRQRVVARREEGRSRQTAAVVAVAYQQEGAAQVDRERAYTGQ